MTSSLTTLDEFLDRLRGGVREDADSEWLSNTPASEIVDAVRVSHAVVIQERTVGGLWEIGLARRIRPRTLLSRKQQAQSYFLNFLVIPVYFDSLFLNVEGDRVMGIAHYPRLSLRPGQSATGEQEVTIVVAAGHKLACFPDGWEMKPLSRKSTRLPREFLVKRGWRFPVASSYIPAV